MSWLSSQQRVRVGRPRRRAADRARTASSARSPRRRARAVVEHRTTHEVGARPGGQQRHVGAEPAAVERGRAEVRRARRRRRPSAARRSTRRRTGPSTQPWPVKSSAHTGPGHAARWSGTAVGRPLAQPVQQQERRRVAPRRPRVTEAVQRERRCGCCAPSTVRRARRRVDVPRPRRDGAGGPASDVGCRRRGGRDRAALAVQELEHQVGDAPRLLDVDEVARRRRTTTRRLPAGRFGSTSSARVRPPHHLGLHGRAPPASARSARAGATSPTRAATGRSRRAAATGRSSSASRRRRAGRPPSRGSAATPSTGGGSSRPRRSASPSIVSGRRCLVAVLAAEVEPAGQLAGEQLGALVVGDVGHRPPAGHAVEVDEGA